MKAGKVIIFSLLTAAVTALPACTVPGEPTTTVITEFFTSSPAVIKPASDNLTPITLTTEASANVTTTANTTIAASTNTTTTVNVTTPEARQFRIVGYISHWHLSRMSEFDLSGLTHLIWQGVEVVSGKDPTLLVAEDAGWDQVRQVAEAGHHADVTVLVSLIGSWNTTSLNEVWSSPELRKELIDNLVDMVETYDLDGVDIDNENTCEPQLFTIFIDELHEALSSRDKIITLAAHPNRVCITPETAAQLDFIGLMTYDLYTGRGYPYHSTFEESVDSMELWADSGIEREKFNMGIPFYGRDATGNGYEYRWIMDTFHPGPDQNEVYSTDKLIWWNGPDLVRKKIEYVMDEGFGGVMVYEIGQDYPGTGSLLSAVYKQVEGMDKQAVSAAEHP